MPDHYTTVLSQVNFPIQTTLTSYRQGGTIRDKSRALPIEQLGEFGAIQITFAVNTPELVLGLQSAIKKERERQTDQLFMLLEVPTTLNKFSGNYF